MMRAEKAARWNHSKKGKAAMRRYKKSPQGRAYRRRWRKTTKGRVTRNRNRAANYAKGAAHLTLAERGTLRRWKADEDQMVLEHLQSDRELALVLRRTVQAIHCRRTKLRQG